MLDTVHLLTPSGFPAIRRRCLETLQVNLGRRCNLSCQHCHVDAGPRRTESMTAATLAEVIAFVRRAGVATVDLTGGAPELNPGFRALVTAARALGCHVIDRCNLTVLELPEQEGLAEFLAEHAVEVVASLPCYLEENVEAQRGKGVFAQSLAALRRLNALGYGDPDGPLRLNLVFNPQGPTLPPCQAGLEADYRRELGDRYGVRFNRLFTLTNMPIRRFGSRLLSKGEFAPYIDLLRNSFQSENLETVMCRTLLSVDWRGYLYDCDFNQMLGMPLRLPGHGPFHIRDLDPRSLDGLPIAVADHCYGCTAGQGSSCGGALG